jgi:putative DNA primase/helicase
MTIEEKIITNGEKKKVSFAEIGDLILSRNLIFTMLDTKEVYYYKKGVYTNKGSIAKLGTLIREVSKKNGHLATRDFVNEVIAYIQAYTYIDREKVDNGNYVNFKNGLFNTDTLELEKHRKDYYSARQIPVNYDPEAKCPNIEKFISEIVTPENIPLIYEWIGYSLISCTKFSKAMMFYGKGSNGKSVLLNLLIIFLGSENVSKESLQKLETDKFSVSNLYGKLMNICPDIPSTTLHNTNLFK